MRVVWKRNDERVKIYLNYSALQPCWIFVVFIINGKEVRSINPLEEAFKKLLLLKISHLIFQQNLSFYTYFPFFFIRKQIQGDKYPKTKFSSKIFNSIQINYFGDLLSKSESVKFSLIESVICIFTDSPVKKYMSLLNRLIITN